jgi:hypothetical protein
MEQAEKSGRADGAANEAWLKSLGWVFDQEAAGKPRMPLGGEAIMADDQRVPVLGRQIQRYQFPASYSRSAALR